MSWFGDALGGLVGGIPVVGGVASNLVQGAFNGGGKSVGCSPPINIAEARALYADPVYYARIRAHVQSWGSANARAKALDVDKAVHWANSPTDDCTSNDAAWNAFLRGLIEERRPASSQWTPTYQEPAPAPAYQQPSSWSGTVNVGGGGASATVTRSTGGFMGVSPLLWVVFAVAVFALLRGAR